MTRISYSPNDLLAAMAEREFMRSVSNALNREMKLKNPEWDMVEVKFSQAAQDIKTGQTKVAVTVIFESNGLGI